MKLRIEPFPAGVHLAEISEQAIRKTAAVGFFPQDTSDQAPRDIVAPAVLAREVEEAALARVGRNGMGDRLKIADLSAAFLVTPRGLPKRLGFGQVARQVLDRGVVGGGHN